jgi:hypothetical protein
MARLDADVTSHLVMQRNFLPLFFLLGQLNNQDIYKFERHCDVGMSCSMKKMLLPIMFVECLHGYDVIEAEKNLCAGGYSKLEGLDYSLHLCIKVSDFFT